MWSVAPPPGWPAAAAAVAAAATRRRRPSGCAPTPWRASPGVAAAGYSSAMRHGFAGLRTHTNAPGGPQLNNTGRNPVWTGHARAHKLQHSHGRCLYSGADRPTGACSAGDAILLQSSHAARPQHTSSCNTPPETASRSSTLPRLGGPASRREASATAGPDLGRRSSRPGRGSCAAESASAAIWSICAASSAAASGDFIPVAQTEIFIGVEVVGPLPKASGTVLRVHSPSGVPGARSGNRWAALTGQEACSVRCEGGMMFHGCFAMCDA